MNNEPLTVGNTHTDGKTLWLHGNAIAQREENGNILFSFAGWPTSTTKERLNGLMYMLNLPRFVTKKGIMHWGEAPISTNYNCWHYADKEGYDAQVEAYIPSK